MNIPMPVHYRTLTAQEQADIRTIWTETKRAYPNESIALAIALTVNARFESDYDRNATPPPSWNEDSAGLFQLNNPRNTQGAILAAQNPDGRFNPAKNTRGILDSIMDNPRDPQGVELFTALDDGTVEDVVDAMCRIIGPADYSSVCDDRAYWGVPGTSSATDTADIYPQYAYQRASALPKMKQVRTPISPIVLAGLGALLVGGIIWGINAKA